METYREDENGWFDEPFLSDVEKGVDLLAEYADWDVKFRQFQLLRSSSSAAEKVRRYHTPSEGHKGFIHFLKQEKVFAFERNQGAPYAAVKNIFAASDAEELSNNELVGLAWRRFRLGALRLRRLNGGGLSNLSTEFVRMFMDFRGYDDRSEVKLAKVEMLYFGMLANSISGILGERIVLGALDELFPGLVEAGSVEDDSAEVDVLLNGFPLSVKCGGAFSVKSFNDYRLGEGKDLPVAYVNRSLPGRPATELRVALPDGHGRYVFGGVELLAEFVREGAVFVDESRWSTTRAASRSGGSVRVFSVGVDASVGSNYVLGRKPVVEVADPFEGFVEELEAVVAAA